MNPDDSRNPKTQKFFKIIILVIAPKNIYISKTDISELHWKLMYTIGANSAVAGSELFWILSIAEGVFLFLILYWQFLFASEEVNLFAMAAPVLPALIGEAHHWFARRQWLSKLRRFWSSITHRYFFPSAHSADFLLLRDGLPHAGFIKTPARSDIPPPCWA